MRKHRFALVLALAAAVLAVVAAGCGGGDDGSASGDGESAACAAAIGIMAPITGDAASIGKEQLNFGKFGLQKYNEDNGTDFTLVEVDTQLDPAQASTGAQKLVSNDDVVAVIGPAGSQEVEAVGPIFAREDLAFVSPSATRTSLTMSGDFPTFFRVVPNDDAQGPTIGEFIASNLEPQLVWIVDDQTSYSTGLADSAAASLEDQGIEVQRESVSQDQSDFSSLASKIKDADVVFLPWQLANKAQVLGQQLKEQGSDAVLFGSDGLFSEDFAIEGSYVSSFAPDIKGIESSQELVSEYETEFGEFTSTFGPPVYAAMNATLAAAQQACENGELTRAAVVEQLEGLDQSESILGQPIAFDDNHDLEGGKFFIFEVQGKGQYELQES